MKVITARSLVIGGWIFAGLSMPLSAFAQTKTTASLQSETAQVDTASAIVSQAETAALASKPLQGGVMKLEDLLQATESADLYKVAVKKLTSGATLTAEEYRSLGVGCVGMESDRTFFQDVAVISDVYKGSPADLAGLRKGDKLIDDNDNDSLAKAHPEIPRWKVTCGQAGTQVQFTLLRHHKKTNITLTRMNIEDIADDKTRHMWEQIIAKLGNPAQGDFEGVGKDPLKDKTIDNNVVDQVSD